MGDQEEELIISHLRNKVFGEPLPPPPPPPPPAPAASNAIRVRDSGLYLFTQLKTPTPRRGRFHRSAGNGNGNGSWKLQGRSEVWDRYMTTKLGFKKTFKFVERDSSRKRRTSTTTGIGVLPKKLYSARSWVMHEYTLLPRDYPQDHQGNNLIWALCRITKGRMAAG